MRTAPAFQVKRVRSLTRACATAPPSTPRLRRDYRLGDRCQDLRGLDRRLSPARPGLTWPRADAASQRGQAAPGRNLHAGDRPPRRLPVRGATALIRDTRGDPHQASRAKLTDRRQSMLAAMTVANKTASIARALLACLAQPLATAGIDARARYLRAGRMRKQRRSGTQTRPFTASEAAPASTWRTSATTSARLR